jgi:hypothetical protein
MQNNTASSKHVRSVVTGDRYWVVVRQCGARAEPALGKDPPELGPRDLGAVGLLDHDGQMRALAYFGKHPTNGFEGFQKKHDKRIRKGEVIVLRSQAASPMTKAS